MGSSSERSYYDQRQRLDQAANIDFLYVKTLEKNEQISSGHLKLEVQKRIGRTITYKTHSAHLNLLLDEKLVKELIDDLIMINDLVSRIQHDKWVRFHQPTFNEKQRHNLFYTNNIESNKYFDKLELIRHEFKEDMKRIKHSSQLKIIREKDNKVILSLDRKTRELIKSTTEKNREALSEYSFLSDIFNAYCPLLYEA